MFQYFLAVLALLIIDAYGQHNFVENFVIGTPKVICAENDVAIDVITSKPFKGNIFVKGRAKDAPCRQSYATNATSSYSLPLGTCGMQKLRSVNPRGLSFAITVIVSFHPAGFITKNDRAFHVKCFYMEPDEIVTSGIEVSQIPTVELSDSMSMPTCDYSVRTGSPTGSIASFSNVGETVYHVWDCHGSDMGMLVKKCFVTDGDGEDHPVVNEIGCSEDSYLVSDVHYDADLMRAYATSQVFKYADSNQLFFTCQIRLCQKQMGMCEGVTPPKCGAGANTDDENITTNGTTALEITREKRSGHYRNIEIDVATPQMLILDRDEHEQLTKSELCMSKLFLPVVPLMLVTVACVSSSLTLLCFKKYCSIPKVVEF